MPTETPAPEPFEESRPEPGEEPSTEEATEEAAEEATPEPTSTPTVRPRPEVKGKFTYAILSTGGNKTVYEVYVINADGTDRHPIALGFRQPSFQPGGHQIAMNGEGSPNQETIFVVDLSEGRPREVSANVEDSRPRWAPDGKQLIFFTSNVRYIVHQLGIARDDVRHNLFYAGTPLFGRDPSWLPDGRFVYNGCDDWAGSTNCGLYITDISGSTQPIDGMPVWAPDGSLVAFVSDRDKIWAVWAIWPEGGEPFKLFDLGGRLGSDWLAEQISWAE
jgi:Tol biopolymer transport system component